MAGALNIFKTVLSDLETTPITVYSAVDGYATVVLMAQVSNIDPANVVLISAAVSNATANTQAFLVKDVAVPPGDAISLLTGRLVMNFGDVLDVQASSNNSAQLTLSLLETLTG